MSITRRIFLRSGALAVVGTTALPSFLTRAAFGAADSGIRTRRLVVIFQRGAADGLNIVVPHGEPSYYAMRPTINIPKKSVLDLDGFFGLHPAMASFQPLWNQKHLAIVHAAGSPDPSRSHFDAQDFMESGTPGLKSTDNGWLNRALLSMPEEKPSPFRAVAFGPYLPRTLQGTSPAVAISDLKQFKMNGPQQTIEGGFEAMYAQTVDAALRGVGSETFEAIDQLKKIKKGKKISPVLLVRGEGQSGVTLTIADGHHRICASWQWDENAPVACRLVAPGK